MAAVGLNRGVVRRVVRSAAIGIAVLLLGAVASIAIAWIVELARGARVSLTAPASEQAVWAPAKDPFGVLPMQVGVIRGAGRVQWTTDRSMFGMGGGAVSPEPLITPPRWFKFPNPGKGNGVSAYGFGLPFLCMRSEAERSLVELAPNSHAMQMRHRGAWILGPWGRFTTVLPLLPIWPGLVADSVVLGLLLTSPWLARSAIRRHRTRGGRCRWCGYDVGGRFDQRCPECGRTTSPTPASD